MKNDICIADAKVLSDYPAVQYVEATPTLDFNTKEKIVHVYPDSIFAVYKCKLRNNLLFSEYTFGSVVSSALNYCEDPIAAVEKAVSVGHNLHYAIPTPTTLSKNPSSKKIVPVLRIGQHIKFQGLYFELMPAANDNIHLQIV